MPRRARLALAAALAFGPAPALADAFYRVAPGPGGSTSAGSAAAPPAGQVNDVLPQAAMPALSASYALTPQDGVSSSGDCTSLPVSNKGAVPVQGLTYAVAPTADFATCAPSVTGAVPPCAGSIPAGGSCAIGIRLRTSTPGTRSGTVTLTSTNGSPGTVTAPVSGTYSPPAATASGTSPLSDSPGSSYVFGSNNGGTVAERYTDGDDTTGMGVANGGYTGLIYPTAVSASGVSMGLSFGVYLGKEYRSESYDYQVSYRDAAGDWHASPRRTLVGSGTYGIPRGTPVNEGFGGNVVATEFRVTFWFGGDVMAAGVTTFRPY